MNIVLHWVIPKSGLADKNEGIRSSTVHGKSFKHVLGCKPLSLSQSVHMTLPDNINQAWKERLRIAINSQFRKDRKAIVFINGVRFEHSARTPHRFANDLANLILRNKKHSSKDTIDAIKLRTHADIAGSVVKR